MNAAAAQPIDSSVQPIASELPLRFAFDGPLGRLLFEHFVRDAESAQLSKKFQLYYRLRPLIPLFIRQLLQRTRNQHLNEASTAWYIQEDFEQQWLETLYAVSRDRQVVHPWPDQYDMAAVLTHDVETEEGVQFVPELAKLEEEYGLRSTWNFVPHKYPLDHGLLSELKWRGHEVGVHGYNHDGRLFESESIFETRRKPINDALQRFGASGFRAPMVHRNLKWMQQLNLSFDASCFDIDPFQAMPGGVGGVWPFFAGKLVELPYTLPQDHTLFVALGETSNRIWLEKFRWLRAMRGMALVITHPDYLKSGGRIEHYRGFLEHVAAQQDCWTAVAGEVAKWWRQRDGLEIVEQDDGTQVVGSCSNRARLISLGDLFAAQYNEMKRGPGKRK